MLECFKALIFSMIGSKRGDNTPHKKETDAKYQKQVKFKSFFLLGDSFLKFHLGLNPKDFTKWIKDNHIEFYNSSIELMKSIEVREIYVLVEKLYGISHVSKQYDELVGFFRKWFVQEHGVFSFPHGERLFVSLAGCSHLLEVLYGVSEDEILEIKSIEEVDKLIVSPEDYKNNWFIGTDSGDELAKAVTNRLIDNAVIGTSHYKLINDDKSKNAYYIGLLKKNGINNYVEIGIQNVTTIPNDEATKKRLNRYEQFNDFAVHAENVFKQFLADTPKAKRFDDYFMLSIWNDKNHPKNDVTYVNVAFGGRPLIISHNNRGYTSTVEEGARLCFYRMETGLVTVTLYPAKTENRKPLEDAIILEQAIDPSKLKDGRLKTYWKQLICCMECTSIDGAPSFSQKRKMFWLRFSKHLIENDIYQPTKLSVSVKNIITFVLSVGLSGFLLVVVQTCNNRKMTDDSQIEFKKEILYHVDSLQNAVHQSTDTISAKIIRLQESLKGPNAKK